jgi:hypothetical protein
LAVVSAETQQILAEENGDGFVLPILSVPRWSRTAQEIQAEAEGILRIPLVILDVFEPLGGRSGFVLAEPFRPYGARLRLDGLQWARPDTFTNRELTAVERSAVVASMTPHQASGGPLARCGWMQEVLDWLSQETGGAHKIDEFIQLNASAQSVLVHLRTWRGPDYWLKAIAPSFGLEYRFTVELVRLFPQFLPRVIAFRDDWNALLMQDEGVHLDNPHMCTPEVIERLGARLAQLQIVSTEHVEEMLAAGFVDMRERSIRTEMRGAIPALERAMSLQDFDGVPRFSRKKLNNICFEVEDLCDLVEALPIPNSLIHNDLHLENILVGKTDCVFIDWAQPGIGNPLLAFEQLRSQFADRPSLHATLKMAYSAGLESVVSSEQIERALAIVPALGVAAELQACLSRSAEFPRDERRFSRHVRVLTRQLDRALQVYRSHHEQRSA